MQPKYLSKEIYHIVNVTEITKSRSDRVSLIITAIFHMYLLDGFTSIMYIGTFKYLLITTDVSSKNISQHF